MLGVEERERAKLPANAQKKETRKVHFEACIKSNDE